jgi:hypothetical protein
MCGDKPKLKKGGPMKTCAVVLGTILVLVCGFASLAAAQAVTVGEVRGPIWITVPSL